MKKNICNIRTLAALLMAGAAFAACSSNDENIVEQQPINPEEQVYTLTINGSSESASTRTLDFDGEGYNKTWTAGDIVTVLKGATSVGTLTASNLTDYNKSATLSGTVSSVAANDVLTLVYNPVNGISAFATQDGTLKGTKGAEKYDMSTSTITVEAVSGGTVTIKETEANFNTQTAMLKLTMQDGSSNKLNATALNMKATFSLPSPLPKVTQDVLTFSPNASTYETNGNGVLYFALPNVDRVTTSVYNKIIADYPTASSLLTEANVKTLLETATVTFTATVGTDEYTCTKTGYKFAAAHHYASTLTMTKKVALLSLDVAGKTIKYLSGETWEQAITNHSTDNDGWLTYSTYVLNGSKALMNGTSFVNSGTAISSEGTYSWQTLSMP